MTKNFHNYFNQWLLKNHGVKNTYELVVKLKHECLIEILDVEEEKQPQSIGEKAHSYKLYKLRKEVLYMEKYFNENPDIINEII